MRWVRRSVLVGAAVAVASLVGGCAPPIPPLSENVSAAHDGGASNGMSGGSTVSADGRFVAFDSTASNLVVGDTNDSSDVFLHDRRAGSTIRISVSSDSTQADGPSQSPSISADGRYVVYSSSASNLVAGGTNGSSGIFLYDRETAITSRITQTADGAVADASSRLPAISGSGRFVAFLSYASNLVPGYSGTSQDVYLHDREAGTFKVISVDLGAGFGPHGTVEYAPSISNDGRFVAYESFSSQLVPGDTNYEADAFLYDDATGETLRVSVASDGTQGDGRAGAPSVSADGRYITFTSNSRNLTSADSLHDQHVYVRDRLMKTTSLVSVAWDGVASANGSSWGQKISANGRYITFHSNAKNMIYGAQPFDTDIYVSDRWTGVIKRVSVPSQRDAAAIRWSSYPAISADGTVIAYARYSLSTQPPDAGSRYADVLVASAPTGW